MDQLPDDQGLKSRWTGNSTGRDASVSCLMQVGGNLWSSLRLATPDVEELELSLARCGPASRTQSRST